MRQLVADAEGAEHVARFQTRARAGRAARNGHVLDAHHQPFAFNVGEGQVQVSGQAFGRVHGFIEINAQAHFAGFDPGAGAEAQGERADNEQQWQGKGSHVNKASWVFWVLFDELVELDDRHEHRQHDQHHHQAHGHDQQGLQKRGELQGAALHLGAQLQGCAV